MMWSNRLRAAAAARKSHARALHARTEKWPAHGTRQTCNLRPAGHITETIPSNSRRDVFGNVTECVVRRRC
eukprot:4612218-Lingulodinium_polyedra.AAC.1